MFVKITCLVALAATVTGCGPSYSPNTYASNAVQQANKVDQGVLVGVREVDVSAAGHSWGGGRKGEVRGGAVTKGVAGTEVVQRAAAPVAEQAEVGRRVALAEDPAHRLVSQLGLE